MFVLFSVSLSHEVPEGVIKLNGALFRRYVQTREPYHPWLVAFVKNGSQACNECLPALTAVAEKCGGFMNVGIVDQDKEPLISLDHKVKKNWTTILFNSEGHSIIDIPCDELKYFHALAESLPQKVLEARPDWLKSSKKKPSLVLVTKSFKPPNFWKAISPYFTKKGLRVGFCNEQEYFMSFGIRDPPKIVYINSTDTFTLNIPHVGDYKTVRKTVNYYMKNIPPPERPLIQRFFKTNKFNDECKEGTICILYYSRSDDEQLEFREQRFLNQKLRFFKGVSKIPYSFVKKNDIWIFNGDNESSIKVDSFSSLDSEIYSVLKGNAEWNNTGGLSIDL